MTKVVIEKLSLLEVKKRSIKAWPIWDIKFSIKKYYYLP